MFLRNIILTLLCLSFNQTQLLAEPLELDLDISKLKFGRLINNNRDTVEPGYNKNVYAVDGHDDLVALEGKNGNRRLKTELALYLSLYKHGHKAMEVFPESIVVEGKEVLLARRYLYGSKSNLEFYLALNSKSIEDLSSIDRNLKQKNHYISDLQYLISKSGHIVISDPFHFDPEIRASLLSTNDAFLALEENLSTVMRSLESSLDLRFARDDVSPKNMRRNLIRLMPEREDAWRKIIHSGFDTDEFDFTKRRSRRPASHKPSTNSTVRSALSQRKPQGKKK